MTILLSPVGKCLILLVHNDRHGRKAFQEAGYGAAEATFVQPEKLGTWRLAFAAAVFCFLRVLLSKMELKHVFRMAFLHDRDPSTSHQKMLPAHAEF